MYSVEQIKAALDQALYCLYLDYPDKTDEMHTALMEASMDGHVEVAAGGRDKNNDKLSLSPF